jgi:hypothetical protein
MNFLVKQLNHCTLYSEFTSLSVYYRHLTVVEIVENVHRFSGTHVTEEICTWSTDRQPAFFYNFPGEGVSRCSDTYKTSLSCHH